MNLDELFRFFDEKTWLVATIFFDSLSKNRNDYSRFARRHLTGNSYAEEGKDYVPFIVDAQMGKRGKFRKEYLISIPYAVKILRVVKSEKATELMKQLIEMQEKERTVLIEIPLRKELYFGYQLESVLKDVALIRKQYAVLTYFVDFFLPDYNLAIEYDEKHHLTTLEHDQKRQKAIEKEIGCAFIRVAEGFEYEGLNEIVKILLTQKKLT